MSWLERKYINLISHRFPNFRWKSSNLANASCPICGDSQKKKSKKRFYFYVKGGNFQAYCHNCGFSSGIKFLLKKIDSGLYNQYRIEAFGHNDPEVVRAEKVTEESFDHDPYLAKLHALPTLQSLPHNHPARIYGETRKLPLGQLYYCDGFMAWANSLVPNKYRAEILQYDSARLVIPYYSFKGKFFAFLGRSINPKQAQRYLLCIISHKHPLLFGLDKIDPKKKCYAVEGPIDSMFLPNCFALSGANLSSLTKLGLSDRVVVVFDNEPHSTETKAKIEHAIDHGLKVCIWPRWVEFKDVNQMIVAGWTPEYILEVIDANTFKGLRARVALQEWSNK